MLHSSRLAELLAARILHDLGSPMASISAILPQANEAAAHAILMETAAELRARMKLFAVAFGSGDDLAWHELGLLLQQGAPMAHRVRFEVPHAMGAMPPGRVRLMLCAALLAAEALPRGGVVRIHQDEAGWVTIVPEGRDPVWSPTFLELMADGSLEGALVQGPRRVLAPFVIVQASAAGAELSFALNAGQALPALMIAPSA